MGKTRLRGQRAEWIYGQFVLGITNTSFSVPSAEIQEADIVFNGYLQTWSTNGAGGATDVLNVAAHEEDRCRSTAQPGGV